ncbi:hypothetical protein HWV03_18000 [Moritella sp. 36]|uniref:hypothetical protein n=1 Tax=Moritella sp. 36 TaxID=2746233 RepID=UPI001BA54F79|nr:hypothetical protein [Moritella sp. 36]QUM90549.1 hypothetical protein HWV03_18000 [Moritella sp. 36]
MKSFNISDAKTEKSRKVRTLIHVINAVVVSIIFMTLLHLVAGFFNIDPNLRVRDMDGKIVFVSLGVMLIGITALFGISLFVISKLFAKFKI